MNQLQYIHTDTLENHKDLLIIDDLLATGGTALAAVELIKNLKIKILWVQVL